MTMATAIPVFILSIAVILQAINSIRMSKQITDLELRLWAFGMDLHRLSRDVKFMEVTGNGTEETQDRRGNDEIPENQPEHP